ncbi:hypothetical protein [Paraburkholderia mimosarum]|uniref:hypothetical protein n=1 Tax=Paraburkholderia mimosarum TaxID=312026 RepID=UPI001EE24B31|nr:hypothetical protein [Paraburkholderia mimosarum]
MTEQPFAPRRDLTETAGARQDQSRELADLQVTYLMAQQFPRDEVKAIDRIENAFTRVGLAEKAQYAFSRGGTDIRGPSIKAMEQIAAIWGNVDAAWRERSRGVDARGIPYSEVEAVAVDLQTRTRKRIAFIVPHWRDTRQGGYVLKDERDVYELCANQAQRRVRACLEAIIPSDVIEVAMTQADRTLKAKADTSPEAMAKMVEAFGEFGVTKEQIEKRIQRRLDAITAAQVVGLKRIYASLRDGMSEAGEWFEKGEDESPEEDGGGDGGAPSGGGTAAVKSRMKASAKKKGDATRAGDTGRVVPYAEVADALHGAKSLEVLNEAADLIRHVNLEAHRDELQALYRERAAEFEEE